MRINDISKNHHGKKFVIMISAVERSTNEYCTDILHVNTKPITVKSKPTNSKNITVVMTSFYLHV